MKKRNIKQEIIKILKNHKEGLTIEDLSRKVKASRNTVSKYVLILLETNQAFMRQVGQAKIIYWGNKNV